jgi:hypothetical protein
VRRRGGKGVCSCRIAYLHRRMPLLNDLHPRGFLVYKYTRIPWNIRQRTTAMNCTKFEPKLSYTESTAQSQPGSPRGDRAHTNTQKKKKSPH